MTHRQNNVYLAHGEARCNPLHCTRKTSCARYMAPMPAHGGSVADFSADIVPFRSCDKWISAQDNRPLQQPPVIRRHPPMGAS